MLILFLLNLGYTITFNVLKFQPNIYIKKYCEVSFRLIITTALFYSKIFMECLDWLS